MAEAAEQTVAQRDDLRRQAVDHDALLTSFLRHWNRLPRAVREDAAELIAASHMEEIEP